MILGGGLSSNLIVLLLQLSVDFFDVNLELLKPLVLPLKILLQITQLTVPLGFTMSQLLLELASEL